MKFFVSKDSLSLFTALFLALLLVGQPLSAQVSLVLSNRADFSTETKSFSGSDTLYAKITAMQMDYTDLKENEFRLKAGNGGEDFEGVFVNHLNGTFTASVALSQITSAQSNWQWRSKLEDNQGHKFDTRVDITVAGSGSSPSDSSKHEVEVRGSIEALGENSITVKGFAFTVDSNTVVRGHDKEMLSFADLTVGQFVEVKGRWMQDASLYAKKIKLEDRGDDDNDHDEMEITGKIESIGDSSLVVNGLEFRVTPNTLIQDHKKNPLDFGDLDVSMQVEVYAEMLADSSLVAKKIKIEDGFRDEVELKGTIESIGASSLVVNGVEFTVDANTRIFDHKENPIAFADLSAGQIVEIHADGTLLATKIKLEDRIEDEIEVTGAIEALTDSSITVSGNTFVVTQKTAVLDQNKAPIPFSSLSVGQVVEVRGDLLPGGVLIALRIKQEDRQHNELEITGPIEAIDAASVQVLGTTFAVDANTAVLDHDKNPIAFGDLEVGQTVEVKGRLQQDSTWYATRIKIERVSVMIGTATAVTPTTVVVANKTFEFSPNLLVLDSKNNLVQSSQLASGQVLEVRATLSANSSQASKIKIYSASVTTGIAGETGSVPVEFSLEQNYPNPFNPETTIRFTIQESGAGAVPVRLSIFNVLGQEVRTLMVGTAKPARYSIKWDGTNQNGRVLPSGMYIYQLRIGEQVVSRRMVMMK